MIAPNITTRARKYRRCNICRGKLEYRVIYNFGDEALGVAYEWMECNGCGAKEKIQ